MHIHMLIKMIIIIIIILIIISVIREYGNKIIFYIRGEEKKDKKSLEVAANKTR